MAAIGLVVVAVFAQAPSCEVDGRVQALTVRLSNGEPFASVVAGDPVARVRFTNEPLAEAQVRSNGVVVRAWARADEVSLQADVGLEFLPLRALAGVPLRMAGVTESGVQLIPAPRKDVEPLVPYIPQTVSRERVHHQRRPDPRVLKEIGQLLGADIDLSAKEGGPALVTLTAPRVVEARPAGRGTYLTAWLSDGARIEGWAAKRPRIDPEGLTGSVVGRTIVCGPFASTLPRLSCSIDLPLFARSWFGDLHEVGVVSAAATFHVDDVDGETVGIWVDGPVRALSEWALALRARDLVHCTAVTAPASERVDR